MDCSCVGSLIHYNPRLANQSGDTSVEGYFGIVSLTGTVSKNSSHIQISFSDSTGKTIGGHLLTGCRIYTTADFIIGYSDADNFTRKKNGTTPWDKLQVHKIKVD